MSYGGEYCTTKPNPSYKQNYNYVIGFKEHSMALTLYLKIVPVLSAKLKRVFICFLSVKNNEHCDINFNQDKSDNQRS